MILDRWENALRYLGLSPEMDVALRFLSGLTPGQLAVNTRVELQGSDVFHVPITGTERIALCSASARPADTAFDVEKDIGFFPGRAVNTVRVPIGWFCICFPDDAHVPCLSGPEEHAIVKLVLKVRAS